MSKEKNHGNQEIKNSRWNMKRTITTETLRQYCLTHNIKLRGGASRPEIEAAITRAALHGIKIESGVCFGYWSQTDIECQYCASENECFNVSLGLADKDKNAYLATFDRMDRIRLVPMKKKTPRKK